MHITARMVSYAFISGVLAAYLVALAWWLKRRAKENARISEILRRTTD